MCSGRPISRRAYRYELRPTRAQRTALQRTAHARRFVHNWALRRSIDHYQRHGRGVSLKRQCRDLTLLKATPAYAWLREHDSQALQQAIFDLRRAYVAFFDGRSRYPRFQSRKSDRPRFRIPQRVRLEGDRIYVPKVGWVRVRMSRPVTGELKSATFKQDSLGKWFVSLVTEFPTPPALSRVRPERTIGIDLGVRTFAALSDGQKVPSPRFLERSMRGLRRRHREFSRTQPGSRNRERARLRLARAYRRTANQRRDFLHKLSSSLVASHDAICIENLYVAGMARSKLSRAIRDSGFRQVRDQLEYKAKWSGKHVVVVPRFFPSSKLCGDCGDINATLVLGQRRWTCDCGALHDRDLNAAQNLRAFGLARLVAAGLADTENARGADVRLPMGAVRDEAGIRPAPEGQHGCALPADLDG